MNTGEYFFERKIVKVKPTGLMDIQWIAERERVEDVLAKGEAAAEVTGESDAQSEKRENASTSE